MWPWEHLVFGYLLFSGAAHLVGGRAPGDRAAVVLAVATQLPDLIDKPLGWVVGVLPAGRSLGHSLLFFAALFLAAWAVERWLGARLARGALVVGYLSHLVGDVVYPVVLGKDLSAGFLLWPLVPAESGGVTGVVLHVSDLWTAYAAYLLSTAGGLALLLELSFLVAGFVVWLADGAPGIPRPSVAG